MKATNRKYQTASSAANQPANLARVEPGAADGLNQLAGNPHPVLATHRDMPTADGIDGFIEAAGVRQWDRETVIRSLV